MVSILRCFALEKILLMNDKFIIDLTKRRLVSERGAKNVLGMKSMNVFLKNV